MTLRSGPFVLAAAAAFVSAAAMPVRAQDARATQVDSLLAAFADPSGPGCAVGVVLDGRLATSRGYGAANLDHDLPLDGRSVFYLASVSKQFTAAAVAMAAAEGHLSLDDDVRAHVPELPDYGTPITVRHLVHHTSGLRDYLTLNSLAGRRSDVPWPEGAFLDLVARQRALNFEPGTEYLYSNTGYVLLTEIVRRATGRSLREYAHERIFRPLGMRDTHFHDDARQVVPRRVTGYSPDGDGGWRVNHWFAFDLVGDGGLYSTVEDLARWVAAFDAGTVGDPALLGLLHQRGVLASGDTLGYAFGLNVGRYRGLRTVEHGGSLAGFRTHVLRAPDERFGAVVLCNTSSANPSQLARRIAEVHLGERMEVVATTAATPQGPPAGQGGGDRAAAPPVSAGNPADFTGAFHSDELDALYRIDRDGDDLVLLRGEGSPLPLRPTGPDELTSGNTILRFERQGGQVVGFVLDSGRVRGITFSRAGAPGPR